MNSITNLINNALLAEQDARKSRERSGKYSPSQFGRCFRAQYYNRSNVPMSNPPDVRSLRVFKAGKLFHDFVQAFLPQHQVEVEVSTADISGYADIVTDDAVWDVKSQHSQAFWYMEKSDYDIAKERFPNILQVTTYAYLLKKPTGRLIFISKDDLTTAEYVFDVEQWRGHIETEISTLVRYWVDKKLPAPQPRCYGVNKKTGEPNECVKYCPWRDYCFESRNIQKGG
jgi:hypothetical protein